MNITIKASDGELFSGSDFKSLEKEVNAYESNLELKRIEQEEKRKKSEAERKVKEEAEHNAWEKVVEAAKYLNEVAKEYSNNHKACIGYNLDTDGVVPRKIVYRSLFSDWFSM